MSIFLKYNLSKSNRLDFNISKLQFGTYFIADLAVTACHDVTESDRALVIHSHSHRVIEKL